MKIKMHIKFYLENAKRRGYLRFGFIRWEDIIKMNLEKLNVL
jgi:hypothetical protein